METPAPMVDPYGRAITSLRVSLTERCNLNCIYCHREGHVCTGHELSCEEIIRACAVGFSLGIRKLKLTGGEPLLRDDLCEVLRSLPPFEDVSLTTNGTLLSSKACELKDAGLHRVNVSLDTLDPTTYKRITGGGALQRVIGGIERAIECELTPVKLNMVLLRGINDSEDALRDMLEFTHSLGGAAVLQLIELIPINGLDGLRGDVGAVEETLEQRASLVWERRMHRRKRYLVDGVEVEVVRPMDNTLFCMHCNRIRLTADGKLKPCLLSEEGLVDIRGLDMESMKRGYMKAVKNRKPYYR